MLPLLQCRHNIIWYELHNGLWIRLPRQKKNVEKGDAFLFLVLQILDNASLLVLYKVCITNLHTMHDTDFKYDELTTANNWIDGIWM